VKQLNITLENLDDCFPDNFTSEQISTAKTLFYKQLALEMHRFYGGKMQTLPKAGLYGFNWFNVWYTPGVSSVSTSIRDNVSIAFELSNRGNLVAVVSDSTRVLGDGDCSAAGGLGVMEGKSFLMKYLADVDAIALCIDSKDVNNKPSTKKIIDFVNMVAPSFGAVNLEDISHPNCYRVLSELQQQCPIPVWHDDAQGTACVTLAGIINALLLANKKIEDCRIVLLGAGASNTTVARLLFLYGADPKKTILFNSKGGLHKNREDIKQDERFYLQWELCQTTNPSCISDFDEAIKGADILVALSVPGPDVVKPYQIALMNTKAIVFACANPVPEIYPYAARLAGAYIVATGRGDFPNQVNNSLGFPGILKGTLLTRSTKITDTMAIAAAKALALYAQKHGLTPEHILPIMTESQVFAEVAEAVAQQAMAEGVAKIEYEKGCVYTITLDAINKTRKLIETMMSGGFIPQPDPAKLQDILKQVIDTVGTCLGAS